MAKKTWEAALEKANENLKEYGAEISVGFDEDTDAYETHIRYGDEWMCWSNYLSEDDLCEDINNALVHARAKAKAMMPKAVTVWVVTFLNDCEFELPNVSVSVFGTEDEARKCLDEEWQTLTSEHENGYDEDISRKSDDDFLFEDHCANRTIGEIKKREITIKKQ